MTKFDKFCNKIVGKIDKGIHKIEKGIKKIDDDIKDIEDKRRAKREYKKVLRKLSEITGLEKDTVEMSIDAYGFIIVGTTIYFAANGLARNAKHGLLSAVGGAVVGAVGGFLYGVFSPVTVPITLIISPFYAK